MAGAAFFFSVMSLLVKLAGQRLPPQEMVLARSAIGATLSGYWLVSRGIPLRGKRRGLLMARGLVGFTALSAFFYALTHLPLADATVIHYTNPVFTAVLAAVFLSEGIRARDLGMILLSLAGVVLLTRPGFLFGGLPGRLDPVAVGVGFGGALGSACAYVLVRKLVRTEEPLVIVFWFASIATLASIPFTLGRGVVPTGPEWLALAGIGVSTQVAQVFLTKGLREERAGRATAVAYMQIVFAAAWGALFFSEYPDLWGVGGALLIVAGTAGIARSPVVTPESAQDRGPALLPPPESPSSGP